MKLSELIKKDPTVWELVWSFLWRAYVIGIGLGVIFYLLAEIFG